MKTAKQLAPKVIAQKISTLKQAQICIQSALDNEADINKHKMSSGTENSMYISILNAFPKLKTVEDVQLAKDKIYDMYYETAEGTRQLGRKGATVKEFPKQRLEAPRYLANICTKLFVAVRPNEDDKGGKFGFAEWLDPKGLHAYPLFNKEDKDGVDGLKKIVKDKEIDPSRNQRNLDEARYKQYQEQQVAELKEERKGSDEDFTAFVNRKIKNAYIV